MKEKLTYTKYMGLDNVIIIDLHNDYSVVAISAPESENKYKVTFRLTENTIQNWKIIENAENVEFNVSAKGLNSTILKYVASLYEDGFFDYYIERDKYEIECFELGNTITEKNTLEVE